MNIYQVIKKPVVTEKSYALAAEKKYTFQVAKEATKDQIARAVEAQFKDTKVSAVNVIKTKGSDVRWRKRGHAPLRGRHPDVKKAVVTLSEGKIDIFEENK
jgi:large subunit ribosomal protein L23